MLAPFQFKILKTQIFAGQLNNNDDQQKDQKPTDFMFALFIQQDEEVTSTAAAATSHSGENLLDPTDMRNVETERGVTEYKYTHKHTCV